MDIVFFVYALFALLIICLYLLFLFMRARSSQLRYSYDARRLGKLQDAVNYRKRANASIAPKKKTRLEDNLFNHLKK